MSPGFDCFGAKTGQATDPKVGPQKHSVPGFAGEALHSTAAMLFVLRGVDHADRACSAPARLWPCNNNLPGPYKPLLQLGCRHSVAQSALLDLAAAGRMTPELLNAPSHFTMTLTFQPSPIQLKSGRRAVEDTCL